MRSLSTKSRDNARTPMQWDANTQAGFTQGTPWLPINPNYVTVNAEAAIADDDSVFHHYRRLIQLRHDHEVIAVGDFALLLPDHEQIWALTRTLGAQQVLVVANCSSEPVAVSNSQVHLSGGEQVLLQTHRGNPAPGTGGELSLNPWESRIYLLH
jgi:oligo-1,6-glucosidase